MPRKALDGRAQLSQRDRPGLGGLAHDGGDPVREGRREPGDRADRAGAEPVVDQRLGADEDVEALDQVRREPLERGIGDLQPGEVGRALAELVQHRQRDGVAARPLELVDVERRRRARCSRGGEVLEQGTLVELEVRRPDHGDRVHACPRGMRGELDRVGGRLRAAVGRDLQPPGGRGDERLDDSPPLVGPEEQPFSGGPEREQAVETRARRGSRRTGRSRPRPA